MMKKYAIGFGFGVLSILGIAATREGQGIFIGKDYGGEPALEAACRTQVTDWILMRSNGVPIFEVPASGIIPTNYGGTGVSTPTTLPVFVVLTGTNGVLYTNQIIGGTIR